MDRKRSWSQDQAATGSPHPPEPQTTTQYNLANALSHGQYTIAWICALPLEMGAARAMLDEVHADLPQDANDKNAYMLGRIGPHNIVIACLPTGQYGTNNATNVFTNLTRSFPAICMGFMVGIGGGVPTMADIRLGDVVVGTRVMPYDLGKVTEGGKIQRTASPRFPDQALLTVVSSIRAKHLLEPSRVPTILMHMAARYPEYGCPTSPDRLFLPKYSHDPQFHCCSRCDQSKLLPKNKRLANDPVIHYGAVASGNHVMKDSTTRDNVARELDIICFEMEAAGLMDVLPCLPIRGICDYSDSHKSKEWQNCAAATAAAYAKEMIEMLPTKKETAESVCTSTPLPYQNASTERRRVLLESLRFSQIDFRKISIKAAHSKTCHWFLKHPQYLAWLDFEKQASHRGFLWIRGKPGVGKSTIMKFIYLETKRNKSQGGALTSSFFFHARGDYLEKSILGMYRSLLLQLLEGYPDLQEVLDDTDLVPKGQNECPPLNALKDLFHTAISKLGQRSFTCFVDALDECDEQQAMEMIRYFEELAETCASKGVRLQICFSSRHYPYIQIQYGMELTLEHQQGHSEDMDNYIRSNLRIRDTALMEELRPQMLEKAADVFLWVVLVVDILNKENRRGRLALRKRLAEAPSALNELFKDILRRDNENMEDLLLCVLWILCAERPLRPEEYYHALWSGLVLDDQVDPELPDATVSDFRDCVRSYVITSSKGLAEITQAKCPTVQFIHESVRDFLVKDRGLQELWPDLGFNWQSYGHEKLKQCCNMYLSHGKVRKFTRIPDYIASSGNPRLRPYPFLEYAGQHLLYHSNAAAQVFPQREFLSQLSVPGLVGAMNLFQKFSIRRYSAKASLLYILADKGLSALIRMWLQDNPETDIRGEHYEYPLFAALAKGNKDSVAALLNLKSTICDGVDVVEGHLRGIHGHRRRTPLAWAARDGHTGLVKLLLQQGSRIDEVDLDGHTPLMGASESGQQATVALLIEKGATVSHCGNKAIYLSLENGHLATAKLRTEASMNWNPDPHSLATALTNASRNGDEALVKFLLDKGAKPDAPDCWGDTAAVLASRGRHFAIVQLLVERGAQVEPGMLSHCLVRASKSGDEAAVRVLIEKGANIEARESCETPLIMAIRCGNDGVVRCLVEQGANIEAQDGSGRTPLMIASRCSHEGVVRCLVEHGANIEAQGESSETPLIMASRRGHEGVVRCLAEQGANIEARDETSGTPLIIASRRGDEGVVRCLVEQGANIDAQDESIRTPLMAASEHGHEAVVRFLARQGASVNVLGVGNVAPLHRTESLETMELLIELGAHVNARTASNQTALHKVFEYSHIDAEPLVKLLLTNGAIVDIPDSEGQTPLHHASDSGTPGAQLLLIEAGADVNAKDNAGQTPLHLLCRRTLFPSFNEDMARNLVRNGADIDEPDNHSDTPRILAEEKGIAFFHTMPRAS